MAGHLNFTAGTILSERDVSRNLLKFSHDTILLERSSGSSAVLTAQGNRIESRVRHSCVSSDPSTCVSKTQSNSNCAPQPESRSEISLFAVFIHCGDADLSCDCIEMVVRSRLVRVSNIATDARFREPPFSHNTRYGCRYALQLEL